MLSTFIIREEFSTMDGLFQKIVMKSEFLFLFVLALGKTYADYLTFRMVMPAWDEAIIGMKVGGKRKIICTPDKAYSIISVLLCRFGEKGTPNIPPYAVSIMTTIFYMIDTHL